MLFRSDGSHWIGTGVDPMGTINEELPNSTPTKSKEKPIFNAGLKDIYSQKFDSSLIILSPFTDGVHFEEIFRERHQIKTIDAHGGTVSGKQ